MAGGESAKPEKQQSPAKSSVCPSVRQKQLRTLLHRIVLKPALLGAEKCADERVRYRVGWGALCAEYCSVKAAGRALGRGLTATWAVFAVSCRPHQAVQFVLRDSGGARSQLTQLA